MICQVSSMFRKIYLSKSSNKTYRFRDSCITSHTVAQSICTHYSSLSGRPDIFLGPGTLKKVQNMSCKKQGAKKQDHCYSKREEAACGCRLTGHMWSAKKNPALHVIETSQLSKFSKINIRNKNRKQYVMYELSVI